MPIVDIFVENPSLKSLAALFVILTTLTGCEQGAEISPFASDGCSLFPDSWPGDRGSWYDCCHEHDIAYWQGGTAHQRMKADEHLRQCVAESTGNEALAWTMYQGVRAGGHPIFPNWYRWGYGWPYGRGYEPLTESESEQVEQHLAEYFRGTTVEDGP